MPQTHSINLQLRRTAIAAVIVSAVTAMAATAALAVEVPGPLVDAAWLKANKANVVILDVRKKAANFEKQGHIPGATLVPWGQVRGKKTVGGVDLIKMLPSAASFSGLMKASGVNKDSAVVITTNGLSSPDLFLGTRLYWQLKYYGHDNVAVLDGGNAAWAAAKLPVSKEKSYAKPGNWKVKAERGELLATTEDVAAMVKGGSKSLVDARTLDYHLGLEQKKKYVYDKGHIPGSRLMPYDILVGHKGPMKFRSPASLKATLTAMGVDLSKPTTSYCNSGHLGSGLWFALHELAGNKGAKLYDGSMHAWTKDKSRPVTQMKLN